MTRLPVLPVLLIAAAATTPLHAQRTTAYTGATLWDGTGAPPVENATLVVRDGRVAAVGRVDTPADARVVDLSGLWIMPGIVDAHTHVTGRWAPRFVTGAEGRILEDLRLFALYGVTAVNSLGGGSEASIRIRDRQTTPRLKDARLRMAGPVITATTPDEARAWVDRNAALGVDWIKLRMDDNLGTVEKMPMEVARAIIDRAHELDLPVATHIFYLDDAKALLRAGTDLIAHSIRDRPVDREVVRLLRRRKVCYVPTLTREVSTFIYARRPAFFDDPFFLEYADRDEMERVTRRDFQMKTRESPLPESAAGGQTQPQDPGHRGRADRVRDGCRPCGTLPGVLRAHGAQAHGRRRAHARGGADQRHERGRALRGILTQRLARAGQVGGLHRARTEPAGEHRQHPDDPCRIYRRQRGTLVRRIRNPRGIEGAEAPDPARRDDEE